MTEVDRGGGLLRAAARAREAHGFAARRLVDADLRLVELAFWDEIGDFVPDRVMRNLALVRRPGRPGLLPPPAGWTDLAGRMVREDVAAARAAWQGNGHAAPGLLRRTMAAFGVEAAIVVPTALLFLGVHPQPEVEVNLARAYNRWAVARLAGEAGLRPFLILPFNVPEACAAIVAEFGAADGIAGFLVPVMRTRGIHDNAYARAYAAIEERALPLAFHAAWHWTESATHQANRFLSVYATQPAQTLAVQATHWIVNAVPERFPRLRVVWMEGGLAWIPFLAQRLDTAYRARPSEAPGLTRLPSEYLCAMHFATHPCDVDEAGLADVVARVGVDTLLWSSGYPQWNFDGPAWIDGAAALDEAARAAILGGNARRLFGLA
ncbi:MAG: amidohydrolase [Alphaproteobacteria bacterium]|nr:amidohydrolase [Alphaproteobacteria bacterium]